MRETHELRHILSLIQSHLDSHDVDLAELEYAIQTHVTDDAEGEDLDVTGQSVHVEFDYRFDFDSRDNA